MFNNGVIPPPIWSYTNYWETYYSGDTTILNHKYKKIEKTEYDIFCLNTVISGPNYIGAIRDDIFQKKVFYIPREDSVEKLIYDFNLGVGDTLISALNFNQPLIVNIVDSILINDEYHKRIQFRYVDAEIIEGIGSRTGLVEELVAFEGGSHLCALYVDTTFVFPDHPCNLSSTDTCLTLNVESQFKDEEFLIFPNPAKDQFQINISTEMLIHNPRIEIFSIAGKIYKNEVLTNEITQIKSNDFKSGIYIVKVYTDKKLNRIEKLIIE
jgi:hypothetical protein